MSKSKQKIQMYTDGSCCANESDRSRRTGGYCAVMRAGNNVMTVVGVAIEKSSNDRMELLAVVSGLRYLAKPSHVDITSDSTYVVNGVNKWCSGWKRNGWKTQNGGDVANKELWQELVALKEEHTLKAKWVKGHCVNPETIEQVANDVCDKLANHAARTADLQAGTVKS